VLAHDRGARVAHRLAMPIMRVRCEQLMLLDIAPTLAMYENTGRNLPTAYWHWFFLIQPPPLPEALIESDPVRYLRSVDGQAACGPGGLCTQRPWRNTNAAYRLPGHGARHLRRLPRQRGPRLGP
jgi:haloacetate dehalogenase